MEQKIQPTVSLSLTVKDAAKALDFYAKALGAEELYRMSSPDGDVGHAEFMIGNTHIYISGEYADWQALAMSEDQTASCLFSISTPDCDQAFARAVKAGAVSLSDPADYFWGTRTGIVRDPFGYRWSFTQRVEDLSPEEIEKRAQGLFSA